MASFHRVAGALLRVIGPLSATSQSFCCSGSVSLGLGRDDECLHLKVADGDHCSVSAWIGHFNLFWMREVCDEPMEFRERRWREIDGRERG